MFADDDDDQQARYENPVYGTEKCDYDNEREAACEPANEYFVRHWGLYKVPPKRTVMRKDCISLTLWPQKLASCLHHLDTFTISDALNVISAPLILPS